MHRLSPVLALLAVAVCTAWVPPAPRAAAVRQWSRSLPPTAHAPGLALARPSDEANGGEESADGAHASGVAGLGARLRQYVRVQITRPLAVHAMLACSVIRRHAIVRTRMRKAEFEEDASRITWIGGAVNLVLAVVKLLAGVYGHSAAMIADAGHSFSDLVSDALTLVTLRMSSLPADVDHPYGHGRFESLGSLAIGLLLLGVGGSFASSSIATLRLGAPQPLGRVALCAPPGRRRPRARHPRAHAAHHSLARRASRASAALLSRAALLPRADIAARRTASPRAGGRRRRPLSPRRRSTARPPPLASG
jgi:hypothetical protein